MAGLPGLRGVEHIGFTVPDIDEATRFFVDIIGCEYVYSLGPFQFEDDWLQVHLHVPAGTVMRELRFFRCRNGPNFEIFEYAPTGQGQLPPLNSDVGGHHMAFYVDDFDTALAYLRRHGVSLMGSPTYRTSGPSAGQTWIYFLTPWGMQLELVSFPGGKLYEKTSDVILWKPDES
ncbi:VOC family protein [Acetobacter musti]|uniref:VOC family protein n=1 Tax=Acetobacter musti TaxID=864732 RepID=A0ABX0JYL9_9PROT|nr:VOC family protein [Acetobacter musti]NHN86604.1 VOC family protein [Acetobacter musti]